MDRFLSFVSFIFLPHGLKRHYGKFAKRQMLQWITWSVLNIDISQSVIDPTIHCISCPSHFYEEWEEENSGSMNAGRSSLWQEQQLQLQGQMQHVRAPPTLVFAFVCHRWDGILSPVGSFYSFFRGHNKAFTPAPALGKHPLTDG